MAVQFDDIVAVELEDGHQGWANCINNRYPESQGRLAAQPKRQRPRPTIVRVPACIRANDAAAYEPTLVSLGPYHNGAPGLTAMKDVKWRYMQDLLARSNAQTNLEGCLKAVKAMEDEARSCYSSFDHVLMMTSKEFGEVLLFDACFIIELFLRQWEKADVEEDDPIRGVAWALPVVREDMLLVENQLPLFVLDKLYVLIFGSTIPCSFVDLALAFYDYGKSSKSTEAVGVDESIYHLLHLIHCHLRPAPSSKNQQGSVRPLPHLYRRNMVTSIPSATQLDEAGVKFEVSAKGAEAGSFLDVKFDKNGGVMEIPAVTIYGWTKTVFRNFIAFEQCFPCLGSHFTSYATFMDCIINTKEDVAVLGREKIIEHWLGSDKEVALLFNSLVKGVYNGVLDEDYMDLVNDVNVYFEEPWHEWRAKLVREYFKSPWAMISLAAGVLVFAMTFGMLFFMVYTYYYPNPILSRRVIANPAPAAAGLNPLKSQ